MSETTYFADVILPLAVPRLYTYRIPRVLNAEIVPGVRVVVQFGKSKLYSALVRKVHTSPPKEYTAKYLDSVLDQGPIVLEKQFEFWDWMCKYYLCHIGEVMNAALPGGFRLTSETRVVMNPNFSSDYTQLDDREYLIAEALEVRMVLSIDEASDILQVKTVYPIIKSMIDKGVVLLEEELKTRYKPRMISLVELTEVANQEEKLEVLFNELERAPKQQQALMAYVQLSQRYSKAPQPVKKLELQEKAQVSASIVNQLVKKEIFSIREVQEGRLQEYEGDSKSLTQLSEAQHAAYTEIQSGFGKQDVTLLHGVTSSGKTEIYVRLIQEAIEQGKQVLYLLPEIALTTQIISRLQRYFGDRVGVYHSKFNQHERVELWNKMLGKAGESYDVVLGARSAVFLPFQNLGLIIVDEEHETSFKQFEPAPRYHARDAAIVKGLKHGAKVLLGSATPSVESYFNALNGKYSLVHLDRRYGGVQLPEIFVADIKEATRKKLMKSHFTPDLLKAMGEALENKEQVILFQNRRGFSPYIICETCGWNPECSRCDVGLTYHKYFEKLRCHYCGLESRMPHTCPACGASTLTLKGFGTEKIEEELGIFFPDANVGRMDLDTTRSRNAYQRIIQSFEDRALDILVGTQMVTKGLDFDNVALVGILNADSLLSFPDFRAFERSFQLMAQVSGRAGRKQKRGKVIIQTYNPHHTIIRQVIDNRYKEMYQDQVLERRNFRYPPFYRLVRMTLKHRDREMTREASAVFANELRRYFGTRVLGPEPPLIGRIRNQYLQQVLLKIERNTRLAPAKNQLEQVLSEFRFENPNFKSVRIVVDVDPM